MKRMYEQAYKDGEVKQLGLLLLLLSVISLAVLIFAGWLGFLLYSVGVVTGYLLTAIMLHLQRYEP